MIAEPTLAINSKDSGWHFRHRPLGLILVIAYKGIWGSIELIAAILLFYSPKLIARELIEDPEDLLVHWILERVHYHPETLAHAAWIIGGLAALKLVIAVALWYRAFFIRPIGLVLFGGLALYGIFHLTFEHFSWFKLFALGADVLILFYFWKILPRHFNHGEVG